MSAEKIKVFVSSVQKELDPERRAVKDFIRNDPLLSRFVDQVFLFEDIPASDRSPDDIYLAEGWILRDLSRHPWKRVWLEKRRQPVAD